MANKYVTPAGAGDKDGSSWENAFGATEFFADIQTGGSIADGDIYYLFTGTYTPTSALTILGNKVQFIGVENQTTLALAQIGNRPLIAMGGNRHLSGIDKVFSHLSYTTANTGNGGEGIRFQTNCAVRHCDFLQTANANTIWQVDTRWVFENCYAKTLATGSFSPFRITGARGIVNNCVSEGGAGVLNNSATTLNTIIINSSFGLQNVSVAINCTSYNCTVGGRAVRREDTIKNCNFVNCDTGLVSLTDENFLPNCDNNNFYDCDTNYTDSLGNATPQIAGNNDTYLDPQFVDADNGNFAIGPNLRSKGIPSQFPNLNTTSYVDIGAVQIREVLPAVDEVLAGIEYGANGTELTGTLVSGGGSRPTVFFG